MKKLLLIFAGIILSISAFAKGHHSVTVYYADYCGACHQEMRTLDLMGVHYKAINVQTSHINIPMIPLTVIDGHSYVGALSRGQLEQLLS